MPRVAVEAVHANQIATHGGLPGLRDEGLLESALARPRHRWAYRRRPDLATLAAAYTYGLARNHPFRDGNKRIAFLTGVMFLGLNGRALDTNDADIVTVILGVASGQITEAALARWYRARIQRKAG